jgi:hypothetical protein
MRIDLNNKRTADVFLAFFHEWRLSDSDRYTFTVGSEEIRSYMQGMLIGKGYHIKFDEEQCITDIVERSIIDLYETGVLQCVLSVLPYLKEENISHFVFDVALLDLSFIKARLKEKGYGILSSWEEDSGRKFITIRKID